MNISPLHDEFGAQVSGVDLSQPLDSATRSELDNAINRYSVLLFRQANAASTPLTTEQQIRFSQYFGALEEEHVTYYSTGAITYVGRIGNILPDGTQFKSDARKARSQSANNMWHSDSSFREIPSLYSLLVAHEVPDEAGETEFVSARSAYQRLDAELKNKINHRIGVHDYIYSRTKVGEDAVTTGQRTYMRPVRQRLVRTNPVTGEHNYFVGSHVRSIEGMEDQTAQPLVKQLIEEATRQQSIYKHEWQRGDVVMWDNRCVLHRGSGYDADRYRRLLLQTRLRGTCPSLAEPGFDLVL